MDVKKLTLLDIQFETQIQLKSFGWAAINMIYETIKKSVISITNSQWLLVCKMDYKSVTSYLYSIISGMTFVINLYNSKVNWIRLGRVSISFLCQRT